MNRKAPLSVQMYPFRSIYPDKYPAKLNEHFVEEMINMYTDPGDTILDPFCGSGVVPSLAVKMDRRAVAYDINDKATALTILSINKGSKMIRVETRDARDMSLLDSTIDFILTSPPYGVGAIDAKHTEYSKIENALENSDNWDTFRIGMNDVLREMYRVLKPGKCALLILKERKQKDRWIPLASYLQVDAISMGWEYLPSGILYCPGPVPFGYPDTEQPWTWGFIQVHESVTVLRKAGTKIKMIKKIKKVDNQQKLV